LPNIEVDEDGKVNVSLHLTDITLKPGKDNSILDKDGSALVIHEGPDDYKTDPAGNSGDRIACAAITAK
jgi:superoxide dismutase, Cu-Zn family